LKHRWLYCTFFCFLVLPGDDLELQEAGDQVDEAVQVRRR
jgi:hypothetical protein